MATQKGTIEFMLETLGKDFSARAMFGEYALYSQGVVVALVCDDLLHVKIVPASEGLRGECEEGAPYPGAKLHYVVTEEDVRSREDLPEILGAVGEEVSLSKKKSSKNRTKIFSDDTSS